MDPKSYGVNYMSAFKRRFVLTPMMEALARFDPSLRIPVAWAALIGFLLATAALAQDPEARRKADLDVLLRILRPTNENITGRINAFDKNWREWQARTGALPPDFDAMPSIAGLPDPFEDVSTPEEWEAKKPQLRKLFEQWVYGSVPPAPANLRAQVTSERKLPNGVTIREVLLTFGPQRKAKLRIELSIPPGDGPFPVFLTNHARTRPWLNTAVRRGYIGCVYFAADPRYGYEDDSESYIEAYPDHDFSTVARWGWSASRAVDYLLTLPEVDGERIGLAGHSRNGKQALFAAAFDERIGAVVPSSGNTGEGDPWRYTTDIFANETLEQITGNFPHWFHPRLRFFVGREHKLPVDQNTLMSLVAPRGLMLATAYSEHQGNSFGFEQAYRAVRQVYRFLGAEDKLALLIRPGIHSTTAGDIEEFVDFFDAVFLRGDFPLHEDWVHNYTFEEWRDISGEEIDPQDYPERETGDVLRFLDGAKVSKAEEWPDRAAEIREHMQWALGEEPPGTEFPPRKALDGLGLTSDGWLGDLHGRPLQLRGGGATELPFGDDLSGELYAGENGKPARQSMPVVVWLHPYAYPTGYSRYAKRPFEELIQRGFAVFAFDQIGFGTRVLDGRLFYNRYPGWSLLGKMIADTRAAVDALASLGESGVIDSNRIYLAGYSLGGKVALWTAAQEERVAGVASVDAFSPLRLDAEDKGIEGIAHYSHLHGLAPRLGFFIGGDQTRLLVDYDDILAAVAPRPALVIAATLDRYHPEEAVREAVDGAREAYALLGAGGALELQTPQDFNRFEADRQQDLIEWLVKAAKID
jgi:pimeloyl-ACP methyl ester carboxylesterase